MVLSGVVFATLVTGVASMQRVNRPHLSKEHSDSDDLSEKLLKIGLKMTHPRSLSAVDSDAEFSCQPADWSPSPQMSTAKVTGETLCSEGKVIPQIYLLGAMKAGTSSIASDLTSLGVAPADGEDKEFHFFGHNLTTHGGFSAALRPSWLDVMPRCPKLPGQSKITADYTPHMHYIPAPEGWRLLGPGCDTALPNTPPNIKCNSVANFSLAYALDRFHTEAEKERLVMVVSLREPLSRMQSAWYASQKCDNHCICPYCRHDSFNESLREQFNEFNRTDSPGISDWFWASHYGLLLERWMKHFPAERFVIMPLGTYSKGGIEPLCTAVAEKAEFTLECDRKKLQVTDEKEVTHQWNTKHPSLEQDAPAKLLAEYKELLSSDKKKLVELLVNAQKKGATLVGYEGMDSTTADAASVEKWLDENW